MSIVMTKSKNKPIKNIISATNSSRVSSFLLRIDKKDRIQLTIKRTIATAVNSSIMVSADWSFIFIEVNTTKHNPNIVADVLSICGDFSFLLLSFSISNRRRAVLFFL